MTDFYRKPDASLWQGRVDDPDDPASFRWHQVIRLLDLTDPAPAEAEEKGFCLLGFSSDEGVRRNKGRTGAAGGPEAIRKAMASLPWHGAAWTGYPGARLHDAGDILCLDGRLEEAQEALASAVVEIRKRGLYPIVLGGGHEVAYGHFTGLRRSLDAQLSGPSGRERLGIINFDAHFDIRPFTEGPSSGTMFAQIAAEAERDGRSFNYLCLGIQKSGNTRALFEKAESLGVEYIGAGELGYPGTGPSSGTIEGFIKRCDRIYLTLCTDVIAAAHAPGVSAPQPFGLEPRLVQSWIREIAASGKTVGFDIAEVCPELDADQRTARLAAQFIFYLTEALL